MKAAGLLRGEAVRRAPLVFAAAPDDLKEVNMETQYRRVGTGLCFLLILVALLGSSELSFGRVRRNPNTPDGLPSYTATVSVTCAGGSTTKSATGIVPDVRIPPPNNLGCNAGTSARAARVVGTGAIVEDATAVGGDRASAGGFLLPVVGVLPFATASLTMQETDVTSSQADYLINWTGDLGTAGQVQWFDLGSSGALDSVSFAGGTSESLTVNVNDPNGGANIRIDAEVDAASVAGTTPEPTSLLLLGSGAIGLSRWLRKRRFMRRGRRRVWRYVRRSRQRHFVRLHGARAAQRYGGA
jgi:PEP-CTERM motif